MKSALFEMRRRRLMAVPAGDPPTPYYPTITSCTPSSGAAGASLVIIGDNFLNVSSVTLGGNAVSSLVVVGSKKMTCTAPSGSGPAALVVTTPAGQVTLPNAFTYAFVMPTVIGVSPNQGPAAGGTAITITGTNFLGATGATINGVACTSVVVVNSTTITAVSPAGTAGARTVAVTTPAGTGSLSNAFTYIAAPTVTSVSPNAGPTAGGQSVTITGTNFTGATAVTFGGVSATGITVFNATTITCTTPARSAGLQTVAVTTPGGTGSNSTVYTYVAAPSISSLNYAQGDVAGGGQSIVITGLNLSGVTQVTIAGNNVSPSGTTSTTVTFTLPAKAAGTYTVAVTSPGGTSGTLAFEYWSPAQLALSIWLRASYAGAPWSSNASAGSSGGRSFAAGTTSPTVGSAQGGFTPASFISTRSLVSATTMAALVSAGAYTFILLSKPNSLSASGGASTPFNDPSLVADTGGGAYVGASISLSGFEPYHLDASAGTYDGPQAAVTTGVYQALFGIYDGTNLSAYVNNGSAVSIAKGNIDGGYVASSGAAKLNEGYAAAGTNGAAVDTLEFAAMPSALAAANKTKFRLYFNQRYGVTV